MPIGTDIEETNRVTEEVEAMVMTAINRSEFIRPAPTASPSSS